LLPLYFYALTAHWGMWVKQVALVQLNGINGSLYACRQWGAGPKEVLLLYSLCHQFLSQLVEGDELYTKVHANTPAAQSEGWASVLMERASRFLWELQCGP